MWTDEATTEDQILLPMELTRLYCSMIHKVRAQNNLPVTYPLYEVILYWPDIPALLSGSLDLIKDECNVDWVEMVWTAERSKYGEYVEHYAEHPKFGRIGIILDISKDHHLDRRYQERKAHQQKMRQRKLNDTVTH